MSESTNQSYQAKPESDGNYSATEHERLELQSAAIDHMMHDTPCHAPLHNPKRILEVGSGTGAMTRQLAAKYPSAEVISNDLSPLPNQETLPENASFIQGDFLTLATDSALLATESFDYVFSRMLVYGMSDWPAYISQAKSLVSTGGFLELQELDTSTFWGADQNALPKSPGMSEMASVFASRGLDVAVAPKLGGYVRDAGFVDVQVKEFRWSYGTWREHPETEMMAKFSTKYLGKANFGAYKRVLGPQKTGDQLAVVESDMMRDFAEHDGKHMRFWVVVARKP
jgi:cyclopropane fatty-acyl-phospholipid synthase-like methyltransferase